MKLHNFTKLMMLFPIVVMKFPNSVVSLKGERSINYKEEKAQKNSHWPFML